MTTSRKLIFALLVAQTAMVSAPALAQCPLTTLSAAGDGDLFGYSVSVEGGLLIVGAPGADSQLPDTGLAHVYQRSPGAWDELLPVGASDASSGDRFGYAVATDGSIVLIGAPYVGNTSPGVYAGAAYVYEWNAGQLVETAKLEPAPGRLFGYSVDLSEGRLFVGAYDPHGATGFVSIFERAGSDWSEAHRIESPALGFGTDLAVDGRTLVVGAPGTGLSYVYELVGADWVRRAELSTSGVFNAVGTSVAIHEDVIVVGAPGADSLGFFGIPSVALVYEQPPGGWADATQTARLEPTNGLSQTGFGTAVEVNESTIVVASAQRLFSGGAHYFQRPEQGWVDAFADSFIGQPGAFTPARYENSHNLVDLDGAVSFLGAPLGTGAGVAPGCVEARVITAPSTFCLAKQDSAGCVPTLSAAGFASLSDPMPYVIATAEVLSGVQGTFFYSLSAPAQLPFLGGTLCVKPPLRRTPVLSTGGNPPPSDCSGTLAFDFNAWAQQGNEPNLFAGDSVYGQSYYRDVAGTFGAGLSGGISFGVCP